VLAEILGIRLSLLAHDESTLLHPRRYRIKFRQGTHPGTDGEVAVAKYLGRGVNLEWEHERLKRVRYGPRVVGVSDGYVLYRWTESRPLEPAESFTHSDVRALAMTSADLHRYPGGHVRLSSFAERVRAGGALIEAAGFGPAQRPADDIANALDESVVSVLRAPRNHGRWHVERGADGGIVRFHRDLSGRSRTIEPAQDLAGLHLELPGVPMDALLERYADATGDFIHPIRFAAGCLLHASDRARDLLEVHDTARAMGSPATDVTSTTPGLELAAVVDRCRAVFGAL
jgi:hypothetical protein